MNRLAKGAMLRIAIGIGGVAISMATLAAEHERASILTIRIYDTVRLPAHTVADMRATAQGALAKARVSLRWVSCSGAEPDSDCAVPLSRREVLVRVVRSHEPAERCGFALATSGPGFVSLASECAARTAADISKGRPIRPYESVTDAEVLGYTLAHELAHVLIPEMQHSSAGLFRARLDRADWQLLPSGRLSFRPKQIALLREAALRRDESRIESIVGLQVAGRGAGTFASPQPR